MKRKLVAMTMACTLAATALTGCGGSSDGGSSAADTKTDSAAAETTTDSAAAETTASDAEGSVYYLNFKPEQDQQWQDLAKAYTEETGVPVTVVTAASGNYETTLMSEMGKSGAPTLFQVNGPVGLANWKDYCYDLAGSDIYSQLTSDSYALKEGDTVYGIAYVIESYGLIVNKTLLQTAGYTIDDIQSFDDLKKVAEDITARSSELGFAAFTSAGMDGSSDWRFKTHLANLTDDDLAMIPIYIGVGDEANQGLCTGTENYWCVNNQADEADIQATLDFMNWCVTSDLGTKTMADDMGFVIPFKGAQESQNLFVKQDTEYTAAGKTPVSWNFTTMPSEEWKNGLGQALTAYAADETDANWDAVVSAFVDGWATEYQLANGQ